MKAPVVAGKYTLLRKLGAGGMAEVFLAKQASEGNFEKLVVIKRILPHLASGAGNRDFVNMFLDEARLASDLRHPNIVTVIDVGKTGDTYFIVMEFLHGQDVRKMQRKNAAWAEQIPLGHCCQVTIDAAAGLHYAHKKCDLQGKPLSIVHRDVSPQNILITYEGGTKIVDFGIAKAATQSTHTSTGVLKGKYTYMSPEQAAGEIVDARTDQFALGIVLWELLTMRRLFKRDSEMLTLEAIMGGVVPRPSRFRAEVPKSIDDVVMRALAKDKRDRFPDCEALALALEDACAREGIVHSQSRLSHYMRRLFADTLAEEATLGLVNPDGSLSRNLTPFTLPPAENRAAVDRMDKPADRPEPQPASAADDKPPVDATTADRKSARSRDDTASRKKSRSSQAAQQAQPSPPSMVTESDANTEPTVVADPPPALLPSLEHRDRESRERRDRGARDRGRTERAIARSQTAGAVGLGAAAVVVLGYLGYAAWASSGPATLIIRTEPKGAAVTIDGRPTGQTTPALLREIEAGTPHKVRVELQGKQPVEEIVTIERRGSTAEMKLELK